MNISEIFNNSIHYAFSDWPKLLILGVLLILGTLYTTLANMANMGDVVKLILIIIAFIACLLVSGYSISLIRSGIEKSEELPSFEIKRNLIDSLKLIVVEIVYAVIIFIIAFVIAFVALGVSAIFGAFNQLTSLLTSTDPTAATLTIIQNPALLASFAVILAVFFIVLVIFEFFFNISVCRLAKSGNISDAFKFGKVWSDIKEIGFGKYIGLYIVMIIMAFVVVLIMALISIIPLIGVFIATLILAPFFVIFGSRALGLLYTNAL